MGFILILFSQTITSILQKSGLSRNVCTATHITEPLFIKHQTVFIAFISRLKNCHCLKQKKKKKFYRSLTTGKGDLNLVSNVRF